MLEMCVYPSSSHGLKILAFLLLSFYFLSKFFLSVKGNSALFTFSTAEKESIRLSMFSPVACFRDAQDTSHAVHSMSNFSEALVIFQRVFQCQFNWQLAASLILTELDGEMSSGE